MSGLFASLVVVCLAALARAQDEQPMCYCDFAYFCEDGPGNPANIIYQLDSKIGSCTATLECEAYCRSIGNQVQDLDSLVTIDQEGTQQPVGEIACAAVTTAYNRDVALYAKVCDREWVYTGLHSNTLLCCVGGFYLYCNEGAEAQCDIRA